MNRIKYLLQISLFILICASCSGNFVTNDGGIYGTTYHFVYSAPEDYDTQLIKVMHDVELQFSPFDSTSVVSALNRGESPVLNNEFRSLFELSQRVNRLSDGAFDPTIAPLVNLWGFGYRNGSDEAPSSEQVDSALLRVGIGECSISAAGVMHRKHPQTEFDFSAIAKGYAVDKVAEYLVDGGADNYMVEIGGEVRVHGNNPRGEAWRVQIDAPVVDSVGVSHNRLRVISMSAGAVATSGNYRNYRDVDGRRIGHTISPLTGQPVATTTLSVTVMADNCALADALATSCMAMPIDKAYKMISDLEEVEALFVVSDEKGAGGYRIVETPGFAK
jgi:thiamine biosynthesis lipoprotein